MADSTRLINAELVDQITSDFVTLYRAIERGQSRGVYELKESHDIFDSAVSLQNYINIARRAAGLIKENTEATGTPEPRVQEV